MDTVLYNTLIRDKQVLKPLDSDFVGVYTCGPTVYNRAHIGNLRAYVFADLLRRVLEFNQYSVKQVMNITDVGHLVSDADEGEDKMALAARKSGKSPWEIAEEYTELFFADCQLLNIKQPHIAVKATDHIQEVIDYVNVLLDKGYAYEIEDGVYFDISKYEDYGQLSRIDLEKQQAGARVAVNEQKINPHDFALWKKAPPEHIMQWESPWGMGYPGWHMECSVLSQKYLGEVFDIHTGGEDHIPVHHENEIAQSVGYCGKVPANIWMHSAFLLMDRGKMSKSLGNVYGLNEVQERGFDPLAYRYMCLNAHYRKQLNFTWGVLESSQTALDRLRKGVARMCSKKGDVVDTDIAHYKTEFATAINDDLNVPKALAVIWEIVRGDAQGQAACQLLREFDEVLALDLFAEAENDNQQAKLDAMFEELIQEREIARGNHNWAKADEIRDRLAEEGIVLFDTKEGTKWEKK